jgi:RecG-like helicase
MGEGKTAGGLWRSLGRWAAASEAELDAEKLKAGSEGAGCMYLADVKDRELARVRGTIHTVTLQPRAGTPALEAELFDGTDVVTLVWLGQRRIGGIDCGRRIIAAGRITTLDGRRVIFNPRYELLPEGAE